MAEKKDYFFIGTPLRAEEDLRPRERKAAVEQGQARTLPVWKQEVVTSSRRSLSYCTAFVRSIVKPSLVSHHEFVT